MAIIKQITEREFIDRMTDEGFSTEASEWLFNYYSDMQEDDVGWDPVAFRCEWTEYRSVYLLLDDEEIPLASYIDFDEYRIIDDGTPVWDADKEDDLLEEVEKHLSRMADVHVCSSTCILVAEH